MSTEVCRRCGAEMRWVHQTWQCPRCLFKLGCCEGEPPRSTEAEAVACHNAPKPV